MDKCPSCQQGTLERHPNGDKTCQNCGYAEYVRQ
jgi:ribosomal protein L37AE/L43A